MWNEQQQQQQQQVYLRGLPSQQQQVPGIIGADDRTHHHHHHHQQHHHHQHHQQHHNQQQQQQQQQHHHHHHHHRSTTMDVAVPSNPRASRNLAEKQRRDNLNTNISTMAALVPTVAGSSRRMDKISILRLAAAFLRTQYTLGRGSAGFLPSNLNDFNLEDYFVGNLIGNGAFFIVLTTTGKIVYVSRQVEQHFGHAQNELMGQSLYNFVHVDDHEELTRNLTPDEMQGTVVVSSPAGVQIAEAANDNNSSSSEDSSSVRNEKKPFLNQRRNFILRMSQRTVSRREHTQYETLHLSGILRLADACKNLEANGGRARHREISSTNNDIVFVGMARLPKKRPITELSISDATKDEYVTRHLVDGRIIYCDHRVSVVAGYLSEEVSGMSAFSFMHKDDFRWTMIGLRQMYDRAETCGSSCYRLQSKTGEFIYLRTHGYLEFDKDTQTVVSFVCINTLVTEEEGVELVREMKERFSATVSDATRAMIQNGDNMALELGSDSQLSNSKSSLEDPSQVEDAITHLFSDLPSPTISEDRLSPSPMPNTQYAKAAIVSQRLPPAAAQASRIGINKIDRYLVLQSKGNRKQEPKPEAVKQERPSANAKLMNSKVIEQVMTKSEIVEQGTARSSGKSMPMHELVNQPRTVLDSPLSVHEPIDPAIKDVSPSHVLRDNGPCEVKIQHAIDSLKSLEKQESSACQGSGVAECGVVVSSNAELKHEHELKRMYDDDDVRQCVTKKKRQNEDLYVSTATDDEQQGTSYCRSFANEDEFPGLSGDFHQYSNLNSQTLKVAESPCSSLHEVNIDYQQIDPTAPLIISNTDDEPFILQDFKDDVLLSPGLDANSDLMMKIFDDIRPAMGFEKTLNEERVQQLMVNNQAVSEGIKRVHRHVENNMALCDSQLNVLAQDLENSALQLQREKLTKYRAEHKMQKQIFKSLQQDHRNIQLNVKHNIGV